MMNDREGAQLDPECLLVGIDVGTSNVKAAAFTAMGELYALASRPLTSDKPRPGWEQFYAEVIIETVVGTVGELSQKIPAGVVRGIAVTSMAETAVPLDNDSRALHPALAWHDQRGTEEVGPFVDKVGQEHLYAITGLGPRHIFGVYKLLWLRANRPEFAQLHRWLNVADYVAYWLSGEQAMDPSLATRTSLLEIRSGQLSEELLDAAGVDASVFADIVESGTALGRLRAEAATATGLPADAIVSVGGHDHPCSALALGMVGGSEVLDSLGTSESVFAVVPRPTTDSTVAISGYEQGRYLIPGSYYTMGGVYTSGASVNWAAGILGLEGERRHARLVEMAADAEPGAGGVLFLPHLRMANPPHNDSRSLGAFVGLKESTGRNEIARAVVEGLVYEFQQTYTGMCAVFGIDPSAIIVTGGGSGNRLGIQMKQHLAGIPAHLSNEAQTTTLGAAMLAAVGSGVHDTIEQAVDAMRCQTDTLTDTLTGQTEYHELYNRYVTLYPALKAFHHQLPVR